MSKGEKNPKLKDGGRRRIRFGRRPAGLMLVVLLALVVIAAYQITMGLGLHDRESFLKELWGVFGIVFLFLLGGAVLGLLLVALKSWQLRRRGPSRWGGDGGGNGADDAD